MGQGNQQRESDCAVTGAFQPAFEGVIEGWVVNYLRQNFWRLASSMEYGDALQEARLMFYDCVRRYCLTPGEVEYDSWSGREVRHVSTPQHFFALFKLAYINQVNDLSKKDTTVRKAPPVTSVLREGQQEPDQLGDLDTDGSILRLLSSAPSEVAEVLMLVLNSPKEMLGIVASSRGRLSHQRRARANTAWCTALGKNPAEHDLVRSVERHFGVQLS